MRFFDQWHYLSTPAGPVVGGHSIIDETLAIKVLPLELLENKCVRAVSDGDIPCLG